MKFNEVVCMELRWSGSAPLFGGYMTGQDLEALLKKIIGKSKLQPVSSLILTYNERRNIL
jgi:hypothetical protein